MGTVRAPLSVAGFAARFLALFAILVIAGGVLKVTRGYAVVLQKSAAIISPAVTGWWAEERAAGQSVEVWLRRGSQQLRFGISMEKLGLGLYPLLSLLLATPGPGWKRSVINAGVGSVSLLAIDLVVVVAYPILVVPGALNDIMGTFLGLLAFVGGPVILWFALTFDHLRGVWGLD